MSGKAVGVVVILTVAAALSRCNLTEDVPNFTNVQLWACDGGLRQQWTMQTGAYPNNTVNMKQLPNMVFDINGWGNNSGSNLQVFGKTNTAWNEQFLYFATNKSIVSLMNQMCITATGASNTTGANIVMEPCKANAGNQQFMYSTQDSMFHYVPNSDLCIDAGTMVNCSIAPYSAYAYCDPSNDVDTRVEDLLSRMQLGEKTQMLQNNNPGVPRLGVPHLRFSECLHGVLSGCGSASGPDSTGCPTSFPHALGLGATFNRSLWSMAGHTVSTEARALNNQGVTGLAFWAPDINLFRDPRWGRGQEVPGEDPFLTAEYVAHYSRGLQEGVDPKYLKIVSTCKHFSAYDLENWEGVSRFQFNAIVSDRDLVEYYWVPFRSCVQRAHAQSIMCSYNAVNGVPSCANSLFHNTIVRDEWGFDGFIVSDCGAVGGISSGHHYANTSDGTCRAGILGGCDVNCGSFYGSHLQDAVNNKALTEGDVNVALRRVLKHMFWLGLLDPADGQYYKTLSSSDVDTAEHRKLALEAAHQMITLLKNDGGMLPLDSEKVSTVAIIGPHGNATQDLLSNYHGTNSLVDSHSPLQAITAMLGSGKVKYIQALDTVSSNDTSQFADAVAAAKSSDVALVFVGLDQHRESEGHDRTMLELPGAQEQLVASILAANKNTVVVLVNGGPLAVQWIKDNIPAIVEAFYPGELGGDAIADILFGKVSPSGRLPYTVYPADFIQRSYFNMDLRNDSGCTYRYYTGKPLWTFGDGLSYTTFSYNWSTPQSPLLSSHRSFDAAAVGRQEDSIEYTVDVTNTGKMDSDVSVLGFITAQEQPDAPLKELFDFGRVHLAAGETATVHLTVGPQELALVDEYGVEAIRPGRYKIQVEELTTDLEITGREHVLFNLPEMKRRHEEKNGL